MKSKKTYHFQRLRNKLPLYDAPDYVWENIEGHFRLREERKGGFRKNFDKLPVHEPGEKIWGQIENTLKHQNKGKLRILSSNSLKIAASVIILLGLSFLVIYHFKTKESILYTYEFESKNVDDAKLEVPVENDQLLILIKTNCLQKPTVCQSKNYIKLENKLMELESEATKMSQLYAANKNEQLLKYMNFIENQKIELQKKILQYANNI